MLGFLRIYIGLGFGPRIVRGWIETQIT
jgi:hypothetical protein